MNKRPVLLWCVYADVGTLVDAHRDSIAMLENAKLLQLFQLLGWSRLQVRISGQKLPAIDIQPHMPQKIAMARLVTIEGNGGPGEVQRSIGIIQNDLHDIWIIG